LVFSNKLLHFKQGPGSSLEMIRASDRSQKPPYRVRKEIGHLACTVEQHHGSKDLVFVDRRTPER
jgi:hypothetical protein